MESRNFRVSDRRKVGRWVGVEIRNHIHRNNMEVAVFGNGKV